MEFVQLRRLTDDTVPTLQPISAIDSDASVSLNYLALALIIVGLFLYSWLLFPCKKAFIALLMEPTYQNLRNVEGWGLFVLLVAIVCFIASNILIFSYLWLVISVLLVPLWFIWLFFFLYYRDIDYYKTGEQKYPDAAPESAPLIAESSR